MAGPIPVSSVDEEYEFVARQRCECGGEFKVTLQTLLEREDSEGRHEGKVDLLSCQCVRCGKMQDFSFDLNSLLDIGVAFSGAEEGGAADSIVLVCPNAECQEEVAVPASAETLPTMCPKCGTTLEHAEPLASGRKAQEPGDARQTQDALEEAAPAERGPEKSPDRLEFTEPRLPDSDSPVEPGATRSPRSGQGSRRLVGVVLLLVVIPVAGLLGYLLGPWKDDQLSTQQELAGNEEREEVSRPSVPAATGEGLPASSRQLPPFASKPQPESDDVVLDPEPTPAPGPVVSVPEPKPGPPSQEQRAPSNPPEVPAPRANTPPDSGTGPSVEQDRPSGHQDDEARLLAKYRAAVLADPDDALAHYNLGNRFAKLGRHGEAVSSLRTAIRLKPDSALAHNSLGYALAELKRYEEAVEALRTSLDLDPRSVSAHQNLFSVYLDTGHFDAAARLCEGLRDVNEEAARRFRAALEPRWIKERIEMARTQLSAARTTGNPKCYDRAVVALNEADRMIDTARHLPPAQAERLRREVAAVRQRLLRQNGTQIPPIRPLISQ